MKNQIAYKIYFLFVFALGIEFGFGMFSTLTQMHPWFVNPTTYVANYSEPQGYINPFPVWTPLVGLLSLITLIVTRKIKADYMKEVRIASGIMLFIVIITFIYFVPTLFKVFGHKWDMADKYPALNDETLLSVTNTWYYLNWVRNITGVILFYVALRGLAKFYSAVYRDSRPVLI